MAEFDYSWWTEEDREKFSKIWPFTPEQSTFNANTLEGAPERRFPLEIPREKQTYSPFDVQAYGQRQEDEKRAMLSMRRSEIDSMVDREEALTSRIVNMARAFGSNISYTPPRRAGRTTDPAKGIAKKEANVMFTSNLLKAISNAPGRQLSGAEVTDFLDKQNAGPDQIAIMNSMKEWIELDDLETLYRKNPETGDLEYLYRYTYQITPEIRAAGWKNDIKELQYQDAITKARGEQEAFDRMTEIEQRINNMPFDERPKTSEEFYKLKKEWGIKLPAVSTRMDQIFSDLVKPGAPAFYTKIVDGKIVSRQMTPREVLSANKNKSGADQWKPYDATLKLQQALQNEFISNAAAAENQRVTDTQLTGEKKKALNKLQFQQMVLSEYKKTGMPILDNEAFNKQSASAYMGEQKKDAAYNTGLSEMMGMQFTSWRDFDERTKNIDPKARLEMVKMLDQQYGDVWKYDQEKRLWNDVGEMRIIQSYPELLEANNAGFVHKEYDKVRFKPTLNYDAGHAIWMNPQAFGDLEVIPLTVQVTTVDDPANPEQKSVVTEQRVIRSLKNEEDIVNAARSDIEKDLVTWNETNEKFTIILDALASEKGLTQMTAVRFLEKLQDPGGVIRESDVALMKAAMGTLYDDFWRLVNLIKTGEQTFLSPTESDQVANAALVMLNVIQGTYKDTVERKREQFENDPYYTWSSKGTEKVNFNRVMPQERYDSIMRIDLPSWNWKTEGFQDKYRKKKKDGEDLSSRAKDLIG